VGRVKLIKRLKTKLLSLVKFTLRVGAFSFLGLFMLYPTGIAPGSDGNDYYEFSPISAPDREIVYPFESFTFITADSVPAINGMSPVSASASGIVIQTRNKNVTHILTAGHVCEPMIAIMPYGFDLTESYQSQVNVVVYDYFGYPHDAEIVGLDPVSDLCLLKSEDTWNEGLVISRSMPHTGEKVYSIAAPRSIFSPGNALLFDGYYTGLDQTMDAYFTIPARPGSSGAAIFNSQGQIVGIIHSAAQDFENLSIASSVYDIDSFLSMYVVFISG